MQKHIVHWQGVPPDKRRQWNIIFALSQEGVHVSGCCPVCGGANLHRYYHIGRPVSRSIEGQQFIAEGALWEWCSQCHVYEHAHALVPAWWQGPIFALQTVTAEPAVLDQLIQDMNNKAG